MEKQTASLEHLSFRGIDPSLLVNQVKHTAGYLWSEPTESLPAHLRELVMHEPRTLSTYSVAEYFRLALLAHHTTCGTFIPTDVDIHIRFKLWASALESAPDQLIPMSDTVLESYTWDSSHNSTRWIVSPKSRTFLSGHAGEWFSTAMAAYGALFGQSSLAANERKQALSTLILRELSDTAQVIDELWETQDGKGLSIACTLSAHNLGDLDRVVDQWKIPLTDPLIAAVYKCGHQPNSHLKSISRTLSRAGALNTQIMAVENHRHFCLREPAALRTKRSYLIGIGPHFDDWGSRIAAQMSTDDLASVVQALLHGFSKLPEPKPVGYARALIGILERAPGGENHLLRYLNSKTGRELKSGEVRKWMNRSESEFSRQWAQTTLKAYGKIAF